MAEVARAIEVAEEKRDGEHAAETEKMANALMSTGGRPSTWPQRGGKYGLTISMVDGRWRVTELDYKGEPSNHYTDVDSERDAFKVARDLGAIFPEVTVGGSLHAIWTVMEPKFREAIERETGLSWKLIDV